MYQVRGFDVSGAGFDVSLMYQVLVFDESGMGL